MRRGPTREGIGVEERGVVEGGGTASVVRSDLPTLFEPDTETTASGKNSQLAVLLDGTWNLEAIVSIRRVDGAGQRGWQAMLGQ